MNRTAKKNKTSVFTSRKILDLLCRTSTASIEDHQQAISASHDTYSCVARRAIQHGIVAAAQKARVLSISLANKDFDCAAAILPHFSAVEVLSAVKLLDQSRQIRATERRIARLHAQGANPKKATTFKVCNDRLNKAKSTDRCRKGGVAGSTIRFLKKYWCRCISSKMLEVDALLLPPDPWVELADLLHLHPTKDFTCDWFLPYCHGTLQQDTLNAEDNLISGMKKCTDVSLIPELLAKVPAAAEVYSAIRKQLLQKGEARLVLPMEARTALARSMPIQDILWHYDEIGVDEHTHDNKYKLHDDHHHCEMCAVVENIVAARLRNGEGLFTSRSTVSTVSTCRSALEKQSSADADAEGTSAATALLHERRNCFGKLAERLLYFQEKGLMKIVELLVPLAEEKLTALHRLGQGHGQGEGEEQEGEENEREKDNKNHEDNNVVMRTTAKKPTHPQQRQQRRTIVLGDASASMEQAIRVSCIIAGLLAASLGSELLFFRSDVTRPLLPGGRSAPSSVAEVMDLVSETHASGATNPATALYELYLHREKVEMVILVTDEEETETCNGMRFAEVFEMYSKEGSPECEVLIISLRDDAKEAGKGGAHCAKGGQMYRELHDKNYEPSTGSGYGYGFGGVGVTESYRYLGLGDSRVRCVTLNLKRPDLKKFDALQRLLILEDQLRVEAAAEKAEVGVGVETDTKTGACTMQGSGIPIEADDAEQGGDCGDCDRDRGELFFDAPVGVTVAADVDVLLPEVTLANLVYAFPHDGVQFEMYESSDRPGVVRQCVRSLSIVKGTSTNTGASAANTTVDDEVEVEVEEECAPKHCSVMLYNSHQDDDILMSSSHDCQMTRMTTKNSQQQVQQQTQQPARHPQWRFPVYKSSVLLSAGSCVDLTTIMVKFSSKEAEDRHVREKRRVGCENIECTFM